VRRATIFFTLFLLFGVANAKRLPQRIISLGPSITEELYLLGVGDRLVGCTTYCKRPEAKTKENVGTVIDVDLEKVVALRPDVVFATSLTDPRAVKRMRNLRIKVVVFPTPRDFKGICNQFLELARLMGKEERAREIIRRVKERVRHIKEGIRGLKQPRVFVEIGARPLFTATHGSFINQLVALAGGVNIAQDAGTGIYSREEVVRRDPDVIIIVTMGITAEEKGVWQKFEGMRAVKNGRIYVMDSYKLCSPTPVTFVEALEEMARILHPGKVSWKKS